MHRLPFDPWLMGTIYSVVSALGYTAANICLRQAADDSHPVWVSCIKAVPAAVVAWLWILRRASLRLPALPPLRVLPALIITGLFMQVGGNVAFQWSLPYIGLAVAVPLIFGTLIIGSALAGRIWLGEPLDRRSAVSMLVMVAAIAVLSMGASGGSHSLESELPLVQILALTAACLAGLSYAACNVVIRGVANSPIPLSATLMVFSTTGVVSLGVIAWWRIGPEGMAATSGEQWLTMISAGVFNAVAFFSLGAALQAISLVRTNLLNASQVAMSAVAGVLLFSEPPTAAMALGVLLTVAGLALVGGRKTQDATEIAAAEEPL